MSPELGRIVPPYPHERCALVGCERVLDEEVGAYLYRDLGTGKLVVFCGDSARFVEMEHGDRFKLVAL